MSEPLCFCNFRLRKTYNSYISVNTFNSKEDKDMFKGLTMVMSYTTFMKWQWAAMATGAGIVGTWWLASKWQQAYNEAREAGVVR